MKNVKKLSLNFKKFYYIIYRHQFSKQQLFFVRDPHRKCIIVNSFNNILL